MSSSNPTPGEGRNLRLIRTGGAPGSGKVLPAALACIMWLAIVWLLYASLVDTRDRDNMNVPAGKSQPLHRAPSRSR